MKVLDSGRHQAVYRDLYGRQRSRSFTSRRDAERWLRQREAEVERGEEPQQQGRFTVAAAAERWWGTLMVEPTTASVYRSRLDKEVLPRWGSRDVRQVRAPDVQAWVKELYARDLARSTVMSYVGLLSAALGTAVMDGFLPANPCAGLRWPKRRTHSDDEVRRQAVTRQEVAAVIPLLPVRYRILPLLAAQAGLRWGECLGLRVSDVDFLGGTITVHQTIAQVGSVTAVKPYPKSEAGRRQVPLADELLLLLAEHLSLFPTDGLVVQTSTGTSPLRQNFGRYWRSAAATAGISPAPRFHDLRGAYSSWLVEGGVPVTEVARLMGHEKPSMTLNRYARASGDWSSAVKAAVALGDDRREETA